MDCLRFQYFRISTIGLAIVATSLLFGVPADAGSSCSQSVPKAMTTAVTAQAANPGTIVEVAASNPTFNTLVQAVQAAGLAEVLSGQGPFTVFAPTDEAFAALPKGTLEKLLQPENRETLKQVLTYHVVPGKLESGSLRSGRVNTVEGKPVNIRIRNKRVQVNDANVTTADVQASNGIIHVIDRVILPPER
jgi:uncharacterized surface protein with fasciclin (FAS1) repeats